MKRKHQVELEQIINDIIEGCPTKTILCKVSPGAGKSMLPIIAGKLITEGLADALCWVCPRKSLQHQGETNFADFFFREMFNHSLSIRSSTNEVDPCRGLSGFITTYQAVGLDEKQTILREFSTKRYILVLDEYHHAEEEGTWHQSLKPLFELAMYRILMTGTIERGDGNQIAFTQYTGGRPDLQANTHFKAIEYSRRDALAERTIIPLRFIFNDGSVTWENKSGDKIAYDSLQKVPKTDSPAAIYTAISTEYAKQLLGIAVAHWDQHRRKTKNPGAKLLIVTANYEHAKLAIAFLKKEYSHYAEIATSHESKECIRTIRRFRAGNLNVLVSIAIAYEGLDCPSISHIVCLTHIRSKPWLEQMFARAIRIDPVAGPYEDQYGYIFAPDDILLQEIVAKIKAEQLPFLKKRSPKRQGLLLFNEEGGEGQGGDRLNITPLASHLTSGRELTLGGSPSAFIAPIPIITPSDQEHTLLKKIESHVRQYSYLSGRSPWDINSDIYAYFGKPRNEMTIPELEGVLKHAKQTYPVRFARGVRSTSRAFPYMGVATT